MKINSVSPVSFKMRLSSDLQERLKREEFKNDSKKLKKYNNLFQASYPNTENTTILDARKNDRGDYEVYLSTELAPGERSLAVILKQPKSLAKSLLLICNKTIDVAEKRLFFKIIKEKVRNYENPRDIKAIADKFEKNKAEKKDSFDSVVDMEIEIRNNLTRIGGGLDY